MNSIKRSMTDQIPSRFGMPTCGRAFVDAARRGTDVRTVVRGGAVPSARTWTVVTDDKAAKAHLGLIPTYAGTSAWRPPIS
ncbi:hypothetical protein [Nocardioides pantholopis]|uniref:hypothetical protein n=1 Tax=Nocardioides pantholopis TaxID=2483798 RepID=UPI000F0773F5|nr:hypothetical protein [Nocardioides pantholopis]